MATRVRNHEYIRFYDIEIKYGGFVLQTEIPQDFKEKNKREKQLVFEYASDLLVKDDQVALALSLMCLDFRKIYFEGIKITEDVKNLIENWLGTQVICDLNPVAEQQITTKDREQYGALFSGGFDSTALLSLMPDNSIPIHLSFGGIFVPETKVIMDYDYSSDVKPVIITTNLYKTMLQRNTDVSHFVQAIPIILLCEHLSLRYFGWGHILESRNKKLFDSQTRLLSKTLPPLEYVGVECIPYTNGLTEYATAKILLSKSQKEIDASYEAARCATGVEKLVRKKILLNALGADIEIEGPLIKIQKNKPSFAMKPFLLIYALQKLGVDRIKQDFKFVPNDIVELIENWDLSFYEKLNPIPLEYFPQALKEDYLNKLSQYGIEVYSDSDFLMYEKVRILVHGIFAGKKGNNLKKIEKMEDKLQEQKQQLREQKKQLNSVRFLSKRLFELLRSRLLEKFKKAKA